MSGSGNQGGFHLKCLYKKALINIYYGEFPGNPISPPPGSFSLTTLVGLDKK